MKPLGAKTVVCLVNASDFYEEMFKAQKTAILIKLYHGTNRQNQTAR